MKKLFSDSSKKVHLLYDDEKAEMKVWSEVTNKACVLSEDEVDNLLRVIEYATDPKEDLAEFFSDGLGFKLGQYAFACLFVDNAKAIAEMVYA
jgi:hypothetical protein